MTTAKPTPRKSTTARARLKGDGAIAQGEKSIALGAKATYAGRDLIQKQIVIAGTDPASRALRNYLEALRAECTVLPIAAMGGDEEARRDVTLDQVYIALDTTTPLPKQKGKRGQREEVNLFGERDEKRLPALDAVLTHEQVALLGGPGSGKSSFVNQLAAEVAAARLKKPHHMTDAPAELLARVPLKIVLRELAERFATLKLDAHSADKALVVAVWAHWSDELKRLGGARAEDKLRTLLQDGKGLLIFDGLDEVALESRLIIRKAVGAVLDQYPSSRVIVTCRNRSYPDSRFEGFTDFTLGTLNEKQIRNFIAAWYGAHVSLKRLQKKEADERAEDLTRAGLDDYRTLASESPLLLTVMAIVHRKGVALPKQEVVLYDEAVKVLLSRWQQEKRLKLHADVQRLLSNPAKLDEVVQTIAYAQHALQGDTQDPQALMPRKDVVDLLEQPDLLGPDFKINEFLNFVDQVSGLLIGHGGSPDLRDKRPLAYGFPHRTFQEYLAGRRMMWGNTRARKRLLLERAQAGDYWAVAARYGWESLAYLGNTRNSDLLDLVRELCPNDAPETPTRWRTTLWAGRMAALAGQEAAARFAEEEADRGLLDRRLIPRLLELTTGNHLPAVERAEAGRALAVLGDPRFDPERWHLPTLNEPLLGFVYIPVGSVFMGTRQSDFDRVMKVIGAEGDVAKDWRERFATHEINPDEADEAPQPLDAFYMARYPTTVAQFQSFARAVGKEMEYATVLQDPHNQPVRGVSWDDAIAYCAWLNEQLVESAHIPESLRALLKGKGYRVTLPSEREWEYAARGPAENNDNPHRIFTWAEDRVEPNHANTFETRIGRPSAVGAFPTGASPFEIQDLIGNVWDWTRSVFKPYPYRADDGREDMADRDNRVVRGGAFLGNEGGARCAFRLWDRPDDRSRYVGFRVVVSPFLFDTDGR